MNSKTRASDLDKEREHEGDPAVDGKSKGPAADKDADGGGQKPADGSHSRHNEGNSGGRS